MGGTIDKILYTSIIAYIFTMISIIIIKPTFMYDKINGKFKQFGMRDNETLMAFPVFGLTSCIAIYTIVVMYTILLQTVK